MATEKTLILTIAGNSVEEIREKLKAIAKEFGIETHGPVQMSLPLTPAETAKLTSGAATAPHEGLSLQNVIEQKPVLRKRGRHPVECDCEKCSTKSVEPTVAATEDVEPAEPEVTREATIEALKEVNAKCGIPMARTILEKFKAKRLSEIQQPDFKNFVEECRKVTSA